MTARLFDQPMSHGSLAEIYREADIAPDDSRPFLVALDRLQIDLLLIGHPMRSIGLVLPRRDQPDGEASNISLHDLQDFLGDRQRRDFILKRSIVEGIYALLRRITSIRWNVAKLVENGRGEHSRFDDRDLDSEAFEVLGPMLRSPPPIPISILRGRLAARHPPVTEVRLLCDRYGVRACRDLGPDTPQRPEIVSIHQAAEFG
jgi:hypothetical protein